MADDAFKLPKASYDQLCRIIRAYGNQQGPASLDQVSHLCALNSTEISRNTGALVSLGIIEGGKSKAATTAGRQLAQALDHDIPEEISKQWRNIVDQSDFLQKVLSAVRIRNGMTIATLQSHIAYSAGEKKSPKSMTGAGTLIEILLTSHHLTESDGSVSVSAPDSLISPFVLDAEPGNVRIGSALRASSKGLRVSRHRRTGVVVNINVNCTADELPALEQRLSDFLDALERRGTGQGDGEED